MSSTSRRHLRVTVVVLILTATVALVATFLTAGHRHPRASTHPRPLVLATTPTEQAGAPPTPLPGTAAATPAVGGAPAVGDIQWTSVAGAAVPVSPTAGPFVRTDGRAHGFADTPLGAVMAAANLTVRLCPQVGPAVFTATAGEQVVGADAPLLRQQLEQDYQAARLRLGVADGAPAGVLSAAARGYQITSYTPHAASVLLLLAGPGPSGQVLLTVAVQLVWMTGDWLLVAPSGGSFDSVAAVATDTTGFTSFEDQGR